MCGEVRQAETGRDHAHKHQQFDHRQHRHHQFEHRGQFYAEDIQRHKQQVGADGGGFRVEVGILHVEIGPNRHGNRRWRKDKLNQRRQTGNQPAGFTKGAATVGKRPARMGDRGGQFGEAEDKTGVKRGDQRGGDQESQRARHRPAITPAKIFA